ncbi:uncharacterized protein BJ212DRAFT_1297375 [Suillus subaureus]|uniref:Uncharacterized protein n=1 Tax=Suillus subaureus TaxID=48587 RepID=A0A9P7EG29_9AGAM|nr:uncharacterized protein BJ212DRAFT_1297375 [Suillus subaureus]KAG1820882.1 hypothetical protein BJ212DRAFT_1297375 [Suillus subaureus]
MCVLFSKEPSYLEHTQDLGETHLGGVEQVVITTVKADGAEFQTSNKPAHIDQAVIKWNKPILLMYASFELGPMLCHGEILCTFQISIQELLAHSDNLHSIIFQPKQGEVVSSCTSLFMTLEQQLSDEHNTTVLCPLTTCRMQNSRDLNQSIKHFEHTMDLCLMDYPYCPAVLFNLGIAKFVSCQADRRYLNLNFSINLFQDALNLCPTDHPDQTVTQLHLAIALLFHFTKWGFQMDANAAEELLSEVLKVCHANNHIYRAALIATKTSAASIDANDLGQEWPAASILLLSLNQLVDRVEWCLQRDEPHALDEVISLHYDALGYYNTGHAYQGGLLGNGGDLDQAITLHREALALCPAMAKTWIRLSHFTGKH